MSEPYISQIILFGGNYAPIGYAKCNGQLLPISENDALFALIGTLYGGDGITTTGLPDLRGRLPVGMGTSPATGTNYPLGAKFGSETVTLTVAQLPSHSHAMHAQSTAATDTSPQDAILAGTDYQAYTDAATTASLATSVISAVGGNQPHNNMMPYLPITFAMALVGTFPTQS